MRIDTSIEAAHIARRNGVKVSFDLDIPAHDLVEELKLCTYKELDEMIRLSDYFIPCIGGAQQLADTGNPLKMTEILQKKYGNIVVALSHGNEGCFVASKTESFRSPAFEIVPIDGTGSGDAFHAGIIYGVIKGWGLKKTAEFANACGAMNPVVMGARSGMCIAGSVEEFIANTTKRV